MAKAPAPEQLRLLDLQALDGKLTPRSSRRRSPERTPGSPIWKLAAVANDLVAATAAVRRRT